MSEQQTGDGVPSGFEVTSQSPSGLSIVEKSTKLIVPGIATPGGGAEPPAAPEPTGILLPTDENFPTVPLPTKKKAPLVPHAVWLAAPGGAIHRLARERKNPTVSAILKSLDEIEAKAKSYVEKTRTGSVLAPASMEDLEQFTTQTASFRNSAFEAFADEQHSTDEIRSMHADADTFFAETLNDNDQLLASKDHQKRIVHQLNEIADVVRFKTKSIKLRGNNTLMEVVQLFENPATVTPVLLDFVSKFDVPQSLAGELLKRMEAADQLTHPIALHLLDKLKSDDPFKVEQRRRVERLTNLLTGDVSEDALRQAKALSKKVITVYVDPDSDPKKDKVGLEIETIPKRIISAPEGTKMGQDADDSMGFLPELRLVPENEVLTYGTKWRERYWNIHLWSGLAEADNLSLHVHINKNPDSQTGVYTMLFGLGDDGVANSDFGTIEIRGTALAGLKVEEGARGFSSEYMPRLVELFYSLRSASLNQASLADMDKDRTNFFMQVVEDPVSRAAMLLTTHTEEHLRIVNPASLRDKLLHPSGGAELFDLVENLPIFDSDIQRLIITASAQDRTLNTFHKIAADADFLNRDVLDLVIDKVIIAKNREVYTAIGKNFNIFTPTQQQRILTAAGADQIPDGFLANAAQYIKFLEPAIANQVIESIIATRNIPGLQTLGSHIDTFSPDTQKDIVTAAFDQTDPLLPIVSIATRMSAIDNELQARIKNYFTANAANLAMASRSIGLFDHELQNFLLTKAKETDNRAALVQMASSINRLEAGLQSQLIMAIIAGKNINALYYAMDLVRTSDLTLYDRLADAAFTFRSKDAIAKLAYTIEKLSIKNQERVVASMQDQGESFSYAITNKIHLLGPEIKKHILKHVLHTPDTSVLVLMGIAKHIDTLPTPPDQQKFVTYVIARGEDAVLEKFAPHMDALPTELQRQIIDAAFDGGHVHALHAIGLFATDIDPHLRQNFLTRYSYSHAGKDYKAAASNAPGWRYMLAA